jgi:hypothetical protein
MFSKISLSLSPVAYSKLPERQANKHHTRTKPPHTTNALFDFPHPIGFFDKIQRCQTTSKNTYTSLHIKSWLKKESKKKGEAS